MNEYEWVCMKSHIKGMNENEWFCKKSQYEKWNDMKKKYLF